MAALLLIDQADSVRATRSVGSVFEAVGGEHRVVQAHADDDRELDGDHRRETGDSGLDEGEADQPDRAQRADGTQDPVLAVPGHDAAGQA